MASIRKLKALFFQRTWLCPGPLYLPGPKRYAFDDMRSRVGKRRTPEAKRHALLEFGFDRYHLDRKADKTKRQSPLAPRSSMPKK